MKVVLTRGSRVQVVSGGTVRVLPPSEGRLLAALAVARPTVLSSDAAVDALWSDRAPPSARRTAQTLMYRLRRRLGAESIASDSTGYRLADDVAVDLDDSPGDDDLILVHGDALATIDHWPPARAARARLHEAHAAAAEERVEQLVACDPGSAAEELEAMVAVLPLREHRWALLVRALCAAKRCPEALRAYERARRVLALELGVTPGPELAQAGAEALEPGESPAALEEIGSGATSNLDAGHSAIVKLVAALDRLPPGPTALRAQLLCRLAVARSHHLPPSQCEGMAREAIAIATAIGRTDLEADAVAALTTLVQDPHRRKELDRLVRRLSVLTSNLDRGDLDRRRQLAVARHAARSGDVADALRTLGEVRESATRDDDVVDAYLAHHAGLLETTVGGDFERARLVADELREIGLRALFDPVAAHLQHYGVVAVLALLDRTVTGLAPAFFEWPLPSMSLATRAWRAAAAAAAGDPRVARAELRLIDAELLGSVERDDYWMPALSMLAEAACCMGDRRTADLVVDRLGEIHDILVIDPGWVFYGATAHFLGLAHAAVRSRRALGYLEGAVDVHRAIGSEWMTARSVLAIRSL